MTEHYTPETLEKGARALWDSSETTRLFRPWDDLDDRTRGTYEGLARAVLDATAGDIAARALEEAADVLARRGVLWRGDDGITVLEAGADATLAEYHADRPRLVPWLRARAARLREGGE